MDSFKPALFQALWAAAVDPAKTFRLIAWPTAGRVLPKVFDGKEVPLDLGQSQPRPPRGMFASEHGITCDLSFDGEWSMVFLPWDCIGAMAAHDHGFLATWSVRLPAQQAEPEARPRLKAV